MYTNYIKKQIINKAQKCGHILEIIIFKGFAKNHVLTIVMNLSCLKFKQTKIMTF